MASSPVDARHGAADSPGTIRVSGDVGREGDWTPDLLRRAFATRLHDVTYTVKGETHTARQCVGLFDVVQAARPRLDPTRKNVLLSFYIVVQGRDGYTAVFSAGELSPDHGARPVWLAFDRDGKPLPANEAPVTLLVPDDQKPSRGVHGVARIQIKEAPVP